MPRAKTTRGRPKTISCPRCGKKFCTVTNVLQHMNQPTGPCYDGSLPLFGEYDNPIDAEAPHSYNTAQLQQEERDPGLADSESYEEYGDIEMDGPGDPAVSVPSRPDIEQLGPGRFVETFEGCGETFPGGKTFMGDFWADQYTEQRCENVYYPWASKQEWAFASWLLRSRLSMAAIDSLLSLDIVSNNFQLSSFSDPLQIKCASLSFRSAKELRARAEVLPSGPKWVCETLQPEYPVKQPLRLFYRNPIDCLQALLSHPLFASHISFVPRKVWTCAARVCRVYDEWLSGDRAWNIQVILSMHFGDAVIDAVPGGITARRYSPRSGLIIGQDEYLRHEW